MQACFHYLIKAWGQMLVLVAVDCATRNPQSVDLAYAAYSRCHSGPASRPICCKVIPNVPNELIKTSGSPEAWRRFYDTITLRDVALARCSISRCASL
jgi:hypothetical protein